MTIKSSRRSFVKGLSAVAALSTPAAVAMASEMGLEGKVIAIVNEAYKDVSKANPEVVKAFAAALLKAETPRLESLEFIRSEGAKNSDAFKNYVVVEFGVATNVSELSSGKKLELLWK